MRYNYFFSLIKVEWKLNNKLQVAAIYVLLPLRAPPCLHLRAVTLLSSGFRPCWTRERLLAFPGLAEAVRQDHDKLPVFPDEDGGSHTSK